MGISIEDYERRILDKYHDSLNVYWGALLTINGLLFSFFSADSIRNSNISSTLNYVLIIFCSLSLCLIIYNFRIIKKNYYDLGTMTTDDMPDVPAHLITEGMSTEEMAKLIDVHTKEWRERDIERAGRSQRITQIRETIIEIFMVVEILIVLAILFSPSLGIGTQNLIKSSGDNNESVIDNSQVGTVENCCSKRETLPPNKSFKLTHTKGCAKRK